MTPYPSGKCGKDGGRYLYYVCTAVLRDQRGCRCQVRRLPVRRLERAVSQFLSSLAGSPDVLSSHLRRSTASDRKELQTVSSRRTARLESLQEIERQLASLVAHFSQDQVPVYVSEEIVRLDGQREEIRKEISSLEARIEELQEGTVSEDDLRQRLAQLGWMDGLSLQEQKAILQGIVGRIEVDVDRSSVSADRQGKSRLRTRRLLLNISLRSSPPAEGRRPRTCAVIPCWGDLDSSRVAAEFVLHHGVPSETPAEVTPAPAVIHETPEERALRFQRMLDLGEVGSRAELARRLGVARSWVTQVLQHLPAPPS